MKRTLKFIRYYGQQPYFAAGYQPALDPDPTARLGNVPRTTKPNKKWDHHNAAGPVLVPVHFEFTHPTNETVYVAGCFNDRPPEAEALHPSGGGRGLKDTVLKPGTYQ